MKLIRHPVVHGHPAHAVLSDLPVTLIPLAFAGSLRAGLRPRSREREAVATWSTRLAFAAASAAGGVGWWDWLTMPSEHPSRSTATLHGILNTSALGALAVASFTRGHRRSALLGGATAGLLVSAWLGGEIVFTFGWRVRPAEEQEIVAKRVSQQGMQDILDAAKHEVSEFEQQETYIPPRNA